MHVLQLPREILNQIIGECFYPSGSEVIRSNCPDYLTLKTCSLVCGSWRQTSQVLLFRIVRLQNTSKFSVFMRAVRATKRSHNAGVLARAVRVLDLHLHESFTRPPATRLDLMQVAELVRECPCVYELCLRGFLNHPEPAVPEALRLCANIRALRLHSLSLAIMHPILHALPAIQFLEICPAHHTALSDMTPLPLKLVELNLISHAPLDGDLLEYLIPKCKGTLEVFVARQAYPFSDGLLCAAIMAASSTLRSLDISVWDDTVVVALRSCARLEELFFRSLDPKVTGPLVETFPKTLCHLALEVNQFSQALMVDDQLAAIRNVGTLMPRLYAVTCFWNAQIPAHLWARAFFEHCDAIGIDVKHYALKSYDNPYPHVRSRGFPRRASVSDFAQMAPEDVATATDTYRLSDDGQLLAQSTSAVPMQSFRRLRTAWGSLRRTLRPSKGRPRP